jgi:Holliday junction resolvase RusA-like endonuclease
MQTEISFVVSGTPVTQGSKEPFVPRYGNGKIVRRHRPSCPASTDRDLPKRTEFDCQCPPMVNTVDDNDGKLGAWRDAVGWAARQAHKGDVLDCLLAVSFEFVKPRPKSHYGSGKNAEVLKDSAPAAPGVRPDALKLARAIEDALTKVVYTDDSLIVSEAISKRYCNRWEPEHVKITIRPLAQQTVGDLVAAGVLELPSPDEEFEQLALLTA